MISSVPPPIGPEAGVARGALDVVLDHVAVAAVDLQAVVHDVEAGALGGQLGHRDLADAVLALVEQAQRVVGEAAAGLDRRRHLGELVADDLEVPDLPAERLALRARTPASCRTRPASPATEPSAISSRSHWKLAMIR